MLYNFGLRRKIKSRKDIDLCLLELDEDVIEAGKINNVVLQKICLPDFELQGGSSCFTTGIRRESKVIDAVSLNLFNETFCLEHSDYNYFGVSLNENQLCAGIPSNAELIAPFNGEHEEDYGGPLICLAPDRSLFLTGVSSSNSLSTKDGHPGMIFLKFESNKESEL